MSEVLPLRKHHGQNLVAQSFPSVGWRGSLIPSCASTYAHSLPGRNSDRNLSKSNSIVTRIRGCQRSLLV